MNGAGRKEQASLRRIEAFVISEEGRDAIAQLMQGAGLAHDAVTIQTGTLETVSRLAGLTPFGDVMIAELGNGSRDTNLDAVREIVGEGVDLVLLGRENDVATYRAFIAAGGRDYCVLPLDRDCAPPDVLTAPAVQSTVKPAQGRMIGVCGVSGGVGASLLATNLAVALTVGSGKKANEQARANRVGLLDADLVFGSLAVDLDMETTQGLRDAFLTPERVDSTFLQATMTEVQPGLSVYAAEFTETDQLLAFELGLQGLLQTLKGEFSTTVVDLPRRLVVQDNALLDELDDIIFVLSPGFGAVRAAGRLMDRLGHRVSTTKVWHVLSHTRRDAGLSAKEITTALDRKITLELPLSASDIASASIKGVPLQFFSPRGAYARTIKRFAQQLCQPRDEDQPVDRRPVWWKRRTAQ